MSRQERIQHAAIGLIALIAAFTALRLGQQVLAPMALALVLGIVLAPLTDLWQRIGIPPVPAVLLSLTFGLFSIVALIFAAEPVVRSFLDQLPMILAEGRSIAFQLKQQFQSVLTMSEDVVAAIDPGGRQQSEDQDFPSMIDALFFAPTIAGQTLIVLGALFFFLLSRDQIYEWVSKRVRHGADPDRVAEVLREAEGQVSRYFLTITLINAIFGLAVMGALSIIGMPSPILWGMVAFVFNFILYLGPITVAVLLTVMGIVQFDGLQSFLPMALFIGLNMIEGQFVTPALVGRQMSVNPLLVFLSLVFALWLWGPLGGFIALPVLIWTLFIVEGITHAPDAKDRDKDISDPVLPGQNAQLGPKPGEHA